MVKPDRQNLVHCRSNCPVPSPYWNSSLLLPDHVSGLEDQLAEHRSTQIILGAPKLLVFKSHRMWKIFLRLRALFPFYRTYSQQEVWRYIPVTLLFTYALISSNFYSIFPWRSESFITNLIWSNFYRKPVEAKSFSSCLTVRNSN